MAQLKDTVVQGTLSATDALISTSVQTSILRAPSSSNSTTYGPGTNGQILRSNGTKVYWGTLAATDIPDVYIKKAGNNDGIMTGTLTLHGLKGTADIDYGTTLPTSPTTGQIFFQISDPWYELPPVGSSDNGKILTVVGGQWTAAAKQNELPSVSSSDNGKVLSVVNGAWASSNSLTTLSNNLGNLSSLTTTTKSSAVAAINEVKAGVDTNSDAIASLENRANYWTLLNSISLPTSYTEVQLYGSRKLSDYSVLIFTPNEGGWFRNSLIVSTTAFNANVGCAVYYPSNSSGAHIEVDIKPKSDTSVEVKYIGTPYGNLYLSMYGIL